MCTNHSTVVNNCGAHAFGLYEQATDKVIITNPHVSIRDGVKATSDTGAGKAGLGGGEGGGGGLLIAGTANIKKKKLLEGKLSHFP